MKEQILKIIKFGTLTIIIGLSVGYALAAWQDPGQNPPGCETDPSKPAYRDGCSTPINVSSQDQRKAGGITLGWLRSLLDLKIGGTGYYDNPSGPFLPETLKLGVNGDIGAVRYCDKDGKNCVTSSGLGGGVAGLVKGRNIVLSSNNYDSATRTYMGVVEVGAIDQSVEGPERWDPPAALEDGCTTNGKVLKWNGSAWVCGDDLVGSDSAGLPQTCGDRQIIKWIGDSRGGWECSQDATGSTPNPTKRFYTWNSGDPKNMGLHDFCALAGEITAKCLVNIGSADGTADDAIVNTLPTSAFDGKKNWYLIGRGVGACAAICVDY